MSYVCREGEIWLHCAREGSKLDDIHADSRVSLEKYSYDHMAKGFEYLQQAKGKTCVLRILVHHMTGKARR